MSPNSCVRNLTWLCHLVSSVVLPPEKAEGCESYLQYLHSEEGERELLRDTTKATGKKRISLDVSTSTTRQHFTPMFITQIYSKGVVSQFRFARIYFSIPKTTTKVDFGTPNNHYWDLEWLPIWVCPFLDWGCGSSEILPLDKSRDHRRVSLKLLTLSHTKSSHCSIPLYLANIISYRSLYSTTGSFFTGRTASLRGSFISNVFLCDLSKCCALQKKLNSKQTFCHNAHLVIPVRFMVHLKGDKHDYIYI